MFVGLVVYMVHEGFGPRLAYSLVPPCPQLSLPHQDSRFFFLACLSPPCMVYAIDNPQAIIAHSQPCLSVVFLSVFDSS